MFGLRKKAKQHTKTPPLFFSHRDHLVVQAYKSYSEFSHDEAQGLKVRDPGKFLSGATLSLLQGAFKDTYSHKICKLLAVDRSLWLKRIF